MGKQPDDPGPHGAAIDPADGGDPVAYVMEPFNPQPSPGLARFWSTLLIGGIVAAAIMVAAWSCLGCIE